MKVTVIALCYNHARFAEECLNSIAKQIDHQLIIVDDCSKDNSVEVIRRWIAENRIDCAFITHDKNQGVCKSLNEALTLATGEFVSIVATDDVWLETKIADQLPYFQDSRVAVVYGDAYRIDAEGKLLEPNFIQTYRHFSTLPEGNIFSTLLEGNFIPAPTVMIRRACLDVVGPYDERLCYEDYDMWLRLAQRFLFAYCPKVGAKYRHLNTSLSTVFRKEIYASNLLIFKKLAVKPRRQILDAYKVLREKDPQNRLKYLFSSMRDVPRLKTALLLLLALLTTAFPLRRKSGAPQPEYRDKA